MRRVLITGASGFIGSFLVEKALEAGFDVHAAIRKTSSLQYLKDGRIRFVEIDFKRQTDLADLFHSLKKEGITFDDVIHNAGITKAASSKDYDLINYSYTRNLVNALREADCLKNKFIFISSLAAAGPGKGVNERELELPPEPITAYGRSKLNADLFIKSVADLPYIIFRPTAVYGPREKDLFTFINWISKGLEIHIGSHEKLLSFIYVKDLADVIVKSLETNFARREYFVADGEKYTTTEFVETTKNILHVKTIKLNLPVPLVRGIASLSDLYSCLTGVPASLNKEKVKELIAPNWLCDAGPLFRDFNFRPAYDLRSGLKETIDWYKKESWI